MEWAKIISLGAFFFATGVATGIAISSYYYEPLSVAVSRWGGFTMVFLAVAGFAVGVFIEKYRRQKFRPLVVGRVEHAGMDVFKAVNATMRRVGLVKVKGESR
jgi:uncharacterized membrane protein YoaK (UPF0700 family)